ncbi:MAG: pyruvate kinase [Planctomycetes bacterium]|nr:pyruvate kinase [Planctomycetota bacterium]
MIRTKVVATVGPACDSDIVLGRMIDAGVNVFRLNFSHGTIEGHGAALGRIRRAAAERGAIVAVLGDLCGPKIRLGEIAGGRCTLVAGRPVTFQRAAMVGTPERLSSSYPALVDDVGVGDRILIDDGNVLLRVTEKRQDEVVALCEVGGVISDRKGINLPDSAVSSPSLTDKDRRDLEWIVGNGLDYVALSFVRRADDLAELRAAISRCDPASPARVVSKIEKPQAVEHIGEIIEASDVVLVARGDLGVEMDVSRVPIIQKELAVACRQAGKPVIVATQMLQSMVDSPVPTRAEVSDVANAILDDADAVMLSAETSVGQYPVQAVQMMRRIAGQTEAFTKRFGQPWSAAPARKPPLARSVIHGASVVAEELNAPLVVVWTLGSDAARLLSRHRLAAPIVALTPNETACRQMSLLYGVVPVCQPEMDTPQMMLRNLDRLVTSRQLAAPGDQVVVVFDMRPEVPGETDAIVVHTVAGGA